MPSFSQSQVESLLGAIDGTTDGYQDTDIILILLDTGLRVNELINLKMENVWLEED